MSLSPRSSEIAEWRISRTRISVPGVYLPLPLPFLPLPFPLPLSPFLPFPLP
eukprot:CAMPEP_0195059942 /NCGR_PEP_ID=MMETSP0448-20130528/7313_1 /TAXON_ID=66468 /ORGANISM="Heterocapsa triquestra, Strain CCMP 448" /LENGTH=51 /DNA_ID=CAMNT_0040090289 /DNA_START=39 /DNA_END=191 /DNA_ORIENTATION=-